MKISQVDVFKYQLAYNHGLYVMSQGRSGTHHSSLVVKLTTDEGVVGWGETAFLSRVHLTAFLESEVAALGVLGGAVLGHDPREPGQIQAVMARSILAGMGAKSAIDTACWDILGKATGLPVASLLGGRLQERVRVWESVPLLTPKVMADYVTTYRSRGVQEFQIKVGNDPHEDAERVAAVCEAAGKGTLVVADANGGWTLQGALVAVRLMASYDIYLEQPCKSLSNCAEVRRSTDLPIIIDENISSMEDLINAKVLAGAGGINLKPSKVGGLTPARLLRDAAAELGMTVTIDDTWGGALTSVALSHLGVSTKPQALLATTFFTELTNPLVADSPKRGADGCGTAPTTPGLGVEVDESLLGEPIITISA